MSAAYDFALCTALRPSLYGYACKLARDKDAAHDLVQDTLLLAWKAWPRFAPKPNVDLKRAVSAWLHQIVHNEYIKGWRKKRVRAHLNVPPSRLADDHDSRAKTNHRDMNMGSDHAIMVGVQYAPQVTDGRTTVDTYSDELEAALGDLSPLRRKIVELVGLHDGSYHEVARILGVPIGTVMSSLNRARNSLIARMSTYAAAEYGITDGRETREEVGHGG